jgi:phosphoribosylformylglycinamidine (FGAM) synthase PurS component
MFLRVEVAMKPQYEDPAASAFLRRLKLSHPAISEKVRWARMLNVYWLEVDAPRSQLITALEEIFHDRVLHWLFTGELLPSAASRFGTLEDLMVHAPDRPGTFWALEKRFRPGVTDNVGRTVREAFEIALGDDLRATQAASGELLLLEGDQLDDEILGEIARKVFCNELIESWTLLETTDLKNNSRFRTENVRMQLPRVQLRGKAGVDTYDLNSLEDKELEKLSRKSLWALTLEEMQAIRSRYQDPEFKSLRKSKGLPEEPTDVEMEVLAQTWSEHCKHKIFAADIQYNGPSPEDQVLPTQINSLFKTTIAQTTRELPKPWLLSVFPTTPVSSHLMRRLPFVSRLRPTIVRPRLILTAAPSPGLSVSIATSWAVV